MLPETSAQLSQEPPQIGLAQITAPQERSKAGHDVTGSVGTVSRVVERRRAEGHEPEAEAA